MSISGCGSVSKKSNTDVESYVNLAPPAHPSSYLLTESLLSNAADFEKGLGLWEFNYHTRPDNLGNVRRDSGKKVRTIRKYNTFIVDQVLNYDGKGRIKEIYTTNEVVFTFYYDGDIAYPYLVNTQYLKDREEPETIREYYRWDEYGNLLSSHAVYSESHSVDTLYVFSSQGPTDVLVEKVSSHKGWIKSYLIRYGRLYMIENDSFAQAYSYNQSNGISYTIIDNLPSSSSEQTIYGSNSDGLRVFRSITDGSGRAKKVFYSYEYDNQGNWISMTMCEDIDIQSELCTPDIGNTIEIRKIDYY